jgi:hypothetical protein
MITPHRRVIMGRMSSNDLCDDIAPMITAIG